eukprot:TRINITY_DN79420_c0_g1_i1.p1 TRINITY_DN79420_c0_g1~~TRINITY_DN79420_c0_g1_i1.p1  ORF type:complete len:539 (-),score=142.95 TRINITY_DN79420_c0_g1_i1:30-1538(-)
MAEVSMLTEKLRKYGTVGAGLITDSMATLRLAEASANSQEGGGYAGEMVSSADGNSSSHRVWQKPSGEGPLTREQVLDILTETVRVQGIVQSAVSNLARKLAKEKGEGKKKKKLLPFLDAHKKIQELALPKEPLEQMNMSDADFQKLLMDYEGDEEVMVKAQELIHPAGKGDPERAKRITFDKIIEIHKFMVVEMQKVLTEFLQLDQETRKQFTSKACETTAELLVSISVEMQLSVHCEDVEQAVIRCEEMLQGNPEFARATEQLASMMQHLTSAALPRAEKVHFLTILRHMSSSTKKAKAFAKKLYEEYRAKTCDVAEAYKRFVDFVDNNGNPPAECEELSPVELQLCYEEYKSDPEVKEAWTQSGIENGMLMANMAASMMKPSSPSSGSSAPEGKMKKTKPSEIIEMQELMVDELKRTSEAAAAASKVAQTPWRGDVAVQMVQALASAAVERRYGVSAEEMTMAGFHHAATLQKSERFVRATEKQQEILMNVAGSCAPPE